MEHNFVATKHAAQISNALLCYWLLLSNDNNLTQQGHIIPGQGDVSNNLPPNMRGAIEDVAASPNDPLFIIHHTMIDCMLDEWLKRHPDAEYPIDPQVRDGHRRDDYVRSFFPLYTNGDMFKRTKEFGYSCSLSNITDPPRMCTFCMRNVNSCMQTD